MKDESNENTLGYQIVDQEGIECLSPRLVMELLKVSRAEVYNIFNSKGFPSFRLGEKKLRVTKADFKVWLQEQKIGA